MKKLLTIVFLLTSLISFSQTKTLFSYKAVSYSYSYETNGKWTEYTDWLACDVNIIADFKSHTIYVDNKNDDRFYIYKTNNIYTTKEGIQVLRLSCTDKNDSYCQCYFTEAPNHTLYFIIEYSDAKIMYALRSL